MESQDPPKFSHEQELRSWLTGKDRVWKQALATRAVLRVIPIVFNLLEFPTNEMPAKREKRLVLQTFRSAFVAWASLSHKLGSSIAAVANAAANETASASTAATEQSPEHYVSLATSTLGGLLAGPPPFIDTSERLARWEVDITASVCSHALRAASETDDAVRMEFFECIAADARMLSKDNDVHKLMNQELWLPEVRGNPSFKVNFPPWARKAFDRMANSDIGRNSAWSEWIRWYRAILATRTRAAHSYFGSSREVGLATSDAAFWEGDPDEVMERIRRVKNAAPNTKLEITGFASGAPGGQPDSDIRVAKPEQSQERSNDAVRIDGISTHTDQPTSLDELGRRPFARALVERMDSVRAESDDGFALHLHAPWGAGKTSVWMMMTEIMTDKKRDKEDRWIAVTFNAWKHESRKTPSWPILETLKSDCIRGLNSQGKWWRAVRVWLKWVRSKFTANFGHFFFPIFALTIAAAIAWLIAHGSEEDTFLSSLTTVFAVIASAGAVFTIFSAAGRLIVFGSVANASEYVENSRNPTKKITDLFASMVKIADAPICIFIDDVDRCHAKYIVELLGTVQTSFRHKNIAYVVAADRLWIRAGFEEQYESFARRIESAEQPLGYLFLEKIFQVSCPLPGINPEVKRAFWGRLLEPDQADGSGDDVHAATAAFDASVAKRRQELRDKFPEGITQKGAEEELADLASYDNRAAVMLELGTSQAAKTQAEHLLARYVTSLPDNPRVMKRMVNTFALRLAIGILEGESVPPHVLARWTIIEQRYPALADLLAETPAFVDKLAAPPASDGTRNLPIKLEPFKDSAALEIIGSHGETGLTSEHVRTITMGSRG
nr:P-loop NTPase fold protein [uncultured Hyphomonas sp.]